MVTAETHCLMIPIGNPEIVVWNHLVTATTGYAFVSTIWTRRVIGGAATIIFFIIPIPAPFPNIAAHVIYSQSIGGFGADGV